MSSNSSSPRMVFLAALFPFVNVMILSYFYYTARTLWTPVNLFDMILSVVFGTIFGALVIWLVFPKIYSPESWDDTFPKIGWVCLIFSVSFGLITLDFFPRDFTPSWVTSEIFPLTLSAFVTYFWFFIGVRNIAKRKIGTSHQPAN